MEYWNNPKLTFTQTVLPYPKDSDPIVASLHEDKHVLFYDPKLHKSKIHYSRTVQDQCAWLNTCTNIWSDRYRIATIVKLHIYIQDIQTQGIVKPLLLFYDDKEGLKIHTGENRLRASELLENLIYFKSFITTHKDHAHLFQHLVQVKNFEQFTRICCTPPGCEYQFTLTDKEAPYGIYWFEYASERTRAVTPGYEWCENVMEEYLKQNPDVVFTPQWFLQPIDWASLDKSNS